MSMSKVSETGKFAEARMHSGRPRKRYVAGNIGSRENGEVSVFVSNPYNAGWS